MLPLIFCEPLRTSVTSAASRIVGLPSKQTVVQIQVAEIRRRLERDVEAAVVGHWKFVTRRVSSTTVTLKLSEPTPPSLSSTWTWTLYVLPILALVYVQVLKAIDVEAVRRDVKSLVEAGDIVPIDTDRPRSVGTRIGEVDDVIEDRVGNTVVSAPASTTGATLLMPITTEYCVKPPSLSMMRAFTVRGARAIAKETGRNDR